MALLFFQGSFQTFQVLQLFPFKVAIDRLTKDLKEESECRAANHKEEADGEYWQ